MSDKAKIEELKRKLEECEEHLRKTKKKVEKKIKQVKKKAEDDADKKVKKVVKKSKDDQIKKVKDVVKKVKDVVDTDDKEKELLQKIKETEEKLIRKQKEIEEGKKKTEEAKEKARKEAERIKKEREERERIENILKGSNLSEYLKVANELGKERFELYNKMRNQRKVSEDRIQEFRKKEEEKINDIKKEIDQLSKPPDSRNILNLNEDNNNPNWDFTVERIKKIKKIIKDSGGLSIQMNTSDILDYNIRVVYKVIKEMKIDPDKIDFTDFVSSLAICNVFGDEKSTKEEINKVRKEGNVKKFLREEMKKSTDELVEYKNIGGVYTLVQLMYILKINDNDCVVFGNEEKTGLRLGKIETKRDVLKPIRIGGIRAIVKQYRKCAGKNKVYVLPFVLGGMGRHANLLIFNPMRQEIERFEPHGSATGIADFDNEKLNKSIEKQLVNKFNKESGLNLKYIPADKTCPSGYKGFQSYEQSARELKGKIGDVYITDPEGYCLSWSYFYMNLRLRFPSLPASQLKKIVYDVIGTDPEKLRQFIRGQTKFVKEEMNKALKPIKMTYLEFIQAHNKYEEFREKEKKLKEKGEELSPNETKEYSKISSIFLKGEDAIAKYAGEELIKMSEAE